MRVWYRRAYIDESEALLTPHLCVLHWLGTGNGAGFEPLWTFSEKGACSGVCLQLLDKRVLEDSLSLAAERPHGGGWGLVD